MFRATVALQIVFAPAPLSESSSKPGSPVWKMRHRNEIITYLHLPVYICNQTRQNVEGYRRSCDQAERRLSQGFTKNCAKMPPRSSFFLGNARPGVCLH